MRLTTILLVLATSSLFALTGCTGSCASDSAGGGQICNDDMSRNVCTSMKGATFDTKPCSARGFQKNKSGTWAK